MKIRELKLTNYRSFSDTQTFSFPTNCSVIAGVNGKGKTAILDALVVLLSRLLPYLAPAEPAYKHIGNDDIHGETERATLELKLMCAGIPIDNYSLKYRRNASRTVVTKLSGVLVQRIRAAYGDPEIEGDEAPLVVYYTTDRAGYRFPKVMPQAARLGQAMAYNGAMFNRTVDYRDFIARYRVTETLTGNAPAVLSKINEALGNFMSGFSNLRVAPNKPTLLVDKNDEVLDIKQLSDGERSFIAMITDLGRRLAIANPDLENPLLGAGVVLIDEIELHLHPKWQSEILEKLRTTFPNIQFIVTTHSPFILQTARQGETILLDEEFAHTIDPSGKSIEDVSRFVMDVENVEYSPRVKNMKEIAKEYLRLAEEAKNANANRKEEIQRELIQMLAPFSDNPAYIALLESKGYINPEQ